MRSITAIRSVLLMLALVCTSSLYAAEPDDLSRIGSRVQQYPVVRAEFTQTKQMADLKRPLVTTGRLVFTRSNGVWWQIDRPYRISYLLSDEKIIEVGADGVRKERGLRDVPGLAQIGRVFRAMLGANTAALHEYFDVSVSGNSKKWHIELKPRQPQIAQFLVKIEIAGGHYIDSIRTIEVGGDSTYIRFRNSQGVSELSGAEARAFAGAPG